MQPHYISMSLFVGKETLVRNHLGSHFYLDQDFWLALEVAIMWALETLRKIVWCSGSKARTLACSARSLAHLYSFKKYPRGIGSYASSSSGIVLQVTLKLFA